MQLIDSHIHLYSTEYGQETRGLIHNGIAKGITRMLMPNVDMGTIQPMLDLSGEFPENCYPMMGLHPCSVQKDFEEVLDKMEKFHEKSKYCAVGEIGMDKYWSLEFIKEQEEALKIQLQLAGKLGLPVSLHTRNCTAEVITIIKQLAIPGLKGVFHCFSGNKEQADEIIEMGFYLGIGGVLTFKNAGLDKVIETIPVQHLILETDGPYLAPVPFRGKRNEPEYLLLIARKLADIKKLSPEETAKITVQNTSTLFGL